MQIILKLTTECNLACVYCSEGDKKPLRLPENAFYKLVDDIPVFSEKTGEKKFDFLFHGGEPLLYGRDKLQALINYTREKLKEFEINFLMQTNGTLIDSDWIAFFKQENISPGISFDGYPEVHDKYRRTKNGETTSEKILANIKAMNEAGIKTGTLMVLNSENEVNAEKLFDFLQENDLSPKIHPVIPCGRASERQDTRLVYERYTELMKKLFELALKNNMKNRIQPLDELMNAVLGLSSVSECSFNGACGTKFICLYPDGAVGFCGRAGEAKELIYGNILKTSLLDLYNSDNADRLRDRQRYLQEYDCKNCNYFELCHGGCAFEALNAYGVLEAKYPSCEGRKKLLYYLRTDGLKLLKEALIREKINHRQKLHKKKKLLKDIDAITLSEVEKSDAY